MSTDKKPVQNAKGPPVWLSSAIKALQAEGVEAARSSIRLSRASKKADGLTELQCLERVARLVARSNPAASLDLLKPVLADAKAPVSAWLLAAMLSDNLGKRLDALKMCKAIVTFERSQPGEIIQAANLLVRLGEQELALKKALAAYDAMGRPLSMTAAVLYITQVTADWPNTDRLTAELRAAYDRGEFATAVESPRTHVLWCDDEAVNLKVLANWSEKTAPRVVPNALKPAPLAGRRLKVGYLSSDFRDHPTSKLMMGAFRNHDRKAFELFMYCSGWDDRSAMRRQVESQFEHIHSVAGMADREAAELIRSHGIDVLVELNGPTRANRVGILAQRAAPVQIAYLGWPGSVGGRMVDYVVGDDETVPAGAEKAYPESVIRLFPTYQVNDHAAQPRPIVQARSAVGLPSDPNLQILGVFNAINKVHQEVWDSWVAILKACPNTVLWLLIAGKAATDRVLKAVEASGISRDRVVIAPKLPEQAHLARLGCADLMLDPWPYGGHTSTADALHAGVPVIALEGRNFAGRVSSGLLKGAGFAELVATSPGDYVAKAVALLNAPETLRALQEKVRATAPASAIFDARARTRQLEIAYRSAVERVFQGKPPVHIRLVPPTTSAVVSSAVPPATLPTPVREKRVAVITPYFRTPPEQLARCCASVKAQTVACQHILVADGAPQELPAGFEGLHFVLPDNIGSGGATPRGLGAQFAFAKGFDAVAFLDADNWYEPHHIETAMKALEAEQLHAVYTRRHIVFPDGEVLGKEDPLERIGHHVDTNCYVISKRAAFLAGMWATYPTDWGSGEDRYVKIIIEAMKLKTRLLPVKTVWYETNWQRHYSMARKEPVAPLRVPSKSIFDKWDPAVAASRTGVPAEQLDAAAKTALASQVVVRTKRHG